MSSPTAEPHPPGRTTTLAAMSTEAEAAAVVERAGYKPELRRSLWRLRKGTAGVKPVEDLVDAPPPAG
jgi:hypothetical protein